MRLTLILLWAVLSMETAKADSPVKADVAVGVKVGTLLSRRGATLYDGIWLSPIFYLGLFEKRVQFFGNSLEYVDFLWEDRLRGRARVAVVGDRPTIKTGAPFTFRNSRQKTFEWTNSLEFFYPNFRTQLIETDLMIAKDFKAHGGIHVELTGRVTLGRWRFEGERPLLQPQIFATLGWGSARHNEYQYGLGAASADLDYFSVGFLMTAPARVDPAYPIVELAYTRVLGGQNRSGTLVSDRTDAIYLTFTSAFGLFSF